MNDIFVQGIGVVSPAGWGLEVFRRALRAGEALAVQSLPCPGARPISVRQVPTPSPRPAFAAHARLRRTSPISQYAVAAGLEALGSHEEKIKRGEMRLGVIVTVMSGCVNYSRRFYDETLKNPATASPLVFPETVFNAPSSHLASLLSATGINYTLVGDAGTFLQGLATAADWLLQGRVDGCLVIGTEELDWLTADAFRLFSRSIIVSDGAGAVFLTNNRGSSTTKLASITDAHLYLQASGAGPAATKMVAELAASPADLLCDGLQNVTSLDRVEIAAWNGFSGRRISPKKILGEGAMAAAAWQCVVAIDALQSGDATRALVSVLGANQQAIGASFETVPRD